MPQDSDEPLRILMDHTLSILSEVLQGAKKVAMLDFPRHHNLGDSFIWLGAENYLRKLGIEVDYIGSLHYFDPIEIRDRVKDSPILINGGGNFGSRYLEQQNYREQILRKFTTQRVVQLPQSLDFPDADHPALLTMQAAARKHPAFTILTRDYVAHETAEKLFPSAENKFCPDLAFGLGSVNATRSPSFQYLGIFRRDDEQRETAEFNLPANSHFTDWHCNTTQFHTLRYLSQRAPEDLTRINSGLAPWTLQRRQARMRRMALLHLEAGRDLVATGSNIISDRLHAVVMARLMGRPAIAVANANGKIEAMHDAYLKEIGGIRFAQSRHEAVEMISQ